MRLVFALAVPNAHQNMKYELKISPLFVSFQAAGIKLIVSAFGSTDAPTTSGADPTDTANTIANFVKQYSLDGVDIDYEVGGT